MNRSAIFFLWRHYNYILVFLLIKTNISLGTLPGALRFSSDKNSSWIFLISALRPLFLLSLFALHPSFITITQGTGTHAHTHAHTHTLHLCFSWNNLSQHIPWGETMVSFPINEQYVVADSWRA